MFFAARLLPHPPAFIYVRLRNALGKSGFTDLELPMYLQAGVEEFGMTYVVTEDCIKCKYQDCIEVCPVDCFYEGENMLVIHPDECIDCGVCEPECPAEAILPDTESAADKWLELNREYSEKWPNITRKGEEPADADDWLNKKNKFETDFSDKPGAGD